MHNAPLSFLIYLLYFKNSKLLNRCELDPCVYDALDSESALELNTEVVTLNPGTPYNYTIIFNIKNLWIFWNVGMRHSMRHRHILEDSSQRKKKKSRIIPRRNWWVPKLKANWASESFCFKTHNLSPIDKAMWKKVPRIFINILCFLPRMNKKRKKCKRTVCMKQGWCEWG